MEERKQSRGEAVVGNGLGAGRQTVGGQAASDKGLWGFLALSWSGKAQGEGSGDKGCGTIGGALDPASGLVADGGLSRFSVTLTADPEGEGSELAVPGGLRTVPPQRLNVHFNNGEHGFDSKVLDTKVIFWAMGPSFRRGREVEPFESAHVYELMCKPLGIVPEASDGHLGTLLPTPPQVGSAPGRHPF